MSKTVSPSSSAGPLTIGQVAELTGVSTHTLRYYEQAGLLRAISRTAAGHRLYAPADLAGLAFVMRLKATGMPIAQIQAFAVLREQGESTFGARRDLLVAHRDAVRAYRGAAGEPRCDRRQDRVLRGAGTGNGTTGETFSLFIGTGRTRWNDSLRIATRAAGTN